MSTLLNKLSQKYLNKEKLGKYLIYAAGELVLITFGVLLAVKINDGIVNSENQVVRCQYLNELNYTLEFDISDVQDNISGFNAWNPKILDLLHLADQKKLPELDSLTDKLSAVTQFIFFNQRTKTKMEELKFSKIDLVKNRALKNKILLYQDEKISLLMHLENRNNALDEDIRVYFLKHNLFGNKLDLPSLQNDPLFLAMVRQKYWNNENMKNIYEQILIEQLEIKALIEAEVSKNCKS